MTAELQWLSLRLADHVHVVDVGHEPLGFDREPNVCIGIFRPALPEAGTQSLHDVVDHAVALLPQSLRGELPLNRRNTNVGTLVASQVSSLQ